MNWTEQEKLALQGNFIDVNIQKYIFDNIRYRHTHNISQRLTFTTYSSNNSENHLVNGLIQQVDDFQRDFKTTDELLNIYWFPTPIQKIIPINGKPSLDIPEINSACTFHYPGNRFISIYRLEEVHKVLYHELIHFYHFDLPLNQYHDRYFKSKYGLSIPCSLRETYSEFLGCLLNIERVSQKTGLPFDLLYSIEFAFMTYQAQKILDYFQIRRKSELYKLKSDTNLITYYIFKLAVFNTLDNPKKTLELLKSDRLMIKKPEDFVENIESGLDTIFFSTKIEKIPELNDTMRMTIIEL